MMTRTTLLALAFVAAATAAAADPVKFGKLAAEPPKEWRSEKPKYRLRSHQFVLPSGAEGVADAEVIVLPESDPKADKVFPRWKAQVTPADGAKPEDAAKESTLAVPGATVKLLDLRGTWKFKEFPMAKKEEERPEYRVVWAVVTAGEDTAHVRLSGPQAVVEKHYPGFEAWLKALK